MKTTVMLGIALLVAGILALAWPVITYTDREEIADLGPLEVTVEERESIRLPPLVGGVAIGVGLVLIITGRRGPSGA